MKKFEKIVAIMFLSRNSSYGSFVSFFPQFLFLFEYLAPHLAVAGESQTNKFGSLYLICIGLSSNRSNLNSLKS